MNEYISNECVKNELALSGVNFSCRADCNDGWERRGGGWGEGAERERKRERRPFHEHGRVILELCMNLGLYMSVDRETERERMRLLNAYRRVYLNCICTLDCIGMLIEREREKEREALTYDTATH